MYIDKMLPHSSGLIRQPSIKSEPSIQTQKTIIKGVLVIKQVPWYYRLCICGLHK